MDTAFAYEFRANHSNILKKVERGESDTCTLTEQIVRGLKHVKQAEEGKVKARSIDEFLIMADSHTKEISIECH